MTVLPPDNTPWWLLLTVLLVVVLALPSLYRGAGRLLRHLTADDEPPTTPREDPER